MLVFFFNAIYISIRVFLGKVYCFDCSLFSGVCQWVYVRRWSRNNAETSSDCSWTAQNTAIKWFSYSCFLRSKQIRIHHADRFLVSYVSCRIWPNWSFELLNVSAISRRFNWVSANTRLRTFPTLCSVITIFRASGCGSSEKDV